MFHIFFSPHCNVIAILLTIILLKITFMSDTWMLFQLVTISCCMQLSRITLQADIPFILYFVFTMTADRNVAWTEGIQTRVEKGTTLIWNMQVVKPTSVHLLRMRVVSPMVISTSVQKQSEKWQNSSAYLHWSSRCPCTNVCIVVFMSEPWDKFTCCCLLQHFPNFSLFTIINSS